MSRSLSSAAQAVSLFGDNNNNNSEGGGGVGGLCGLLCVPTIAYLSLLSVLANACIGMIEPLVPLFLSMGSSSNSGSGNDEGGGEGGGGGLQLSILAQGLIFACATFSYLLFTPIAGMLSDARPKHLCVCVGMTAMGCGLCLFLLAAHITSTSASSSSSTSGEETIAVVCVALFLVGCGMSFVDTPILPLLSEILEVCE